MTADPARRVLVLAPTSKDAELSRAVLERAALAVHCCTDIEDVCRELDNGAGALVIPEETVANEGKAPLRAWLQRQPSWSDLPILVLANRGADSGTLTQTMDLLGNITVLERPMRVAALVSALRSALRARERQYELRAQLAEREQHLAALREADLRKDQFLATLAHELRNPLAPISNSVQALRSHKAAGPYVEHLVSVMERQVGHLVRLVDDLLEISRVTRGRIDLQVAPCDIAGIVKAAVETSQPLIDAARHQLTVTVPSEPLIVHGDAMRLAQVLANLLNNAAKYTEEGGRIWLTAYREGMAVVISVRDSGVGILPEMLSHVFELFMQLPATASRSLGGLGIGLSLVKSLVGMHGGSVEAYSAGPGKGSTFTVRLPLAAAPSQTAIAPREAPGHLPKLRPRRVLVVDDNRDAADSLAMLLRLLMGEQPHVVYGGAAALAALPDAAPEVVFVDIGMPEMDGHEVARRIRRMPEWQDLRLVAMTGWGQDEDRRRSRQAGFDQHLIKPVDVRALENVLRGLDAAKPAEEARG